MAQYDYFYDQQIRRFLTQFVRAFSGFQYMVGGRDGGEPTLRTVPCRMANQNRQVSHIMKNNSENTLLSVPMFTVWVKEMGPNRARTQNPSHVSTVQVTERALDGNGNYTGERGNGYTVERQMPHPLDITLQVDLWTSNEHQKHQLWEQVYMAFNIGFDIQSSENPLDWTALTRVELDSTVWSSRSIPVGASDEIDVASFIFKLPVWITPPAKVKQQKLIHQIVTNILEGEFEGKPDRLNDNEIQMSSEALMSRVIVTPKNARIRIEGDEITLLAVKGLETNAAGELMNWQELLKPYGPFKPGESQLRLRADIEQDIELDIIGTLNFDPSRPNVIYWQVDPDTLPANTLAPVNAIIDPMKHFPLSDLNGNREAVLPAPQEGQRYMLLHDLGQTVAWGTLKNSSGAVVDSHGNPISAHEGDVLEYQNGFWTIVFDASATTQVHYLVNLRSGKQLKFHDGTWIMAIDGEYHPGFWRLRL